jgi:hypothetical protein
MGQFDCGGREGWKRTAAEHIFQVMEPLEKCMAALRVLIGQSADPSGVVLAGRAVDAYLAAYPKPASKIGAIAFLKERLEFDRSQSKGGQLGFVNLVFDYLDKHKRNLCDQP